jgi:hypothetical protein
VSPQRKRIFCEKVLCIWLNKDDLPAKYGNVGK